MDFLSAGVLKGSQDHAGARHQMWKVLSLREDSQALFCTALSEALHQ